MSGDAFDSRLVVVAFGLVVFGPLAIVDILVRFEVLVRLEVRVTVDLVQEGEQAFSCPLELTAKLPPRDQLVGTWGDAVAKEADSTGYIVTER